MRRFPHVAGTAHVPAGWVHRFGNAMLCGPFTHRPQFKPLTPGSKVCEQCADHLIKLRALTDDLLTELNRTASQAGPKPKGKP